MYSRIDFLSKYSTKVNVPGLIHAMRCAGNYPFATSERPVIGSLLKNILPKEFEPDNKVIDTDVEKALSDFTEESKKIIDSTIARNEVVLTGPLELESLNIYDARCYKGFLTSRFFLLYKENGETKMFNGDAVIRMKNENTIDTVYRWVS